MTKLVLQIEGCWLVMGCLRAQGAGGCVESEGHRSSRDWGRDGEGAADRGGFLHLCSPLPPPRPRCLRDLSKGLSESELHLGKMASDFLMED